MRGTLRIYLGAAPGVGKTYAMLDEGRRRVERGTDVVVGYVETHSRPHTIEKLAGLEVVPRRRVPYRGQVFEEMDLAAVIARRPQLVLVDELAHTNTPGLEHEKRWQDVQDILNAGINVVATLNLQHLESVNDIVENITGVAQRETIPDDVVRHAEQVQLVDMTPEALRRRLAHGNVYPAERVDAALTNFFRPGNLAALRELALLWLADRVDEELQDYRERHGIDHRWETKERVVVAIVDGEDTERVVRRAARMASRAKGELIGVHVRRDDGLVATDGSLAHAIELLEQLGGRFVEVVAPDVAAGLVGAARAENATQLVLSASQRSRVSTLIHGSIVARCVALARGEIDVHVISADPDATPAASTRRQRRFRLAPIGVARTLISLVVGVVAFPLATLVLPHASSGSLALATSVYLLIVLAVAATGGIVPGLAAALAAFFVTNYEFTPPRHTFTISDTRDLIALLAFLAAALTVAGFVDLSARRSLAAARAERDARALARLARHVVSGDNVLDDMVGEIASAFGLRGAQLRRRGGGEVMAAVGSVGERSTVIALSSEHELCVDGPALGAERQDLLVAVTAQLVAALDRRRLEAEAAERTSLREAEDLRAGLLAAVSHDLRTPLATIKAAATTLLDSGEILGAPERTELLETIDDGVDRLDALIGDLLDMSRVHQGTIELATRSFDLRECATRAVGDATRWTGVPGARVITAGESRTVVSDPVLVERIVFNLVTNALIHAGGGPVEVDVGFGADWASVRVVDHGPGIARESREAVFRPLQRRDDVANGHGVGLGLAIARGFAETLGGDLSIDDTPGGGTTMVLTLPSESGAT